MIHRDSYRYLILGGIISVASGVFGWIGLVAPQLLGWPLNVPFWAKVALFLLGCSPILWFSAFRLHIRSIWVFRNETPVTMYLQVETEKDSESTSYYACLRNSAEGNVVHRISVYPPSWNCESIKQTRPAQVFMDHISNKPLVVQIEGKRLWAMAL